LKGISIFNEDLRRKIGINLDAFYISLSTHYFFLGFSMRASLCIAMANWYIFMIYHIINYTMSS